MALAEVSEFIILSISLFEMKFKIDLTRTNLCIQYSIKMWRILNVDKILCMYLFCDRTRLNKILVFQSCYLVRSTQELCPPGGVSVIF